MKKIDRKLLSVLRKKQVEVSGLPTQKFGVLTPQYKMAVSYLKVQPWRVIFLTSLVAVLLLRLIFGSSFVKIATLLQAGF